MIRRDCQKEALACIQTTTDVTNLQLCTGAGKSYIIYDASILPTVQTCMIIVPSLLLIQQYYKDMKSHYDGKTLYYFATEGTLKGGIKRLTAEFPELESSAWIVLTTFASVPLLYNHLVEKKRAIHQVIADEAHHVKGAEYAKSYALAKPYIRHTIHFSATLPEGLTPHYTYPLLKGIRDKVVRDFHIEVVMCKEGDVTSLPEIIQKGIERLDGVNAKILAYTAQANTDNSSVKTFLKEYTLVMKTNDWWMDGINDETTSKSKCIEEFEASTKKASLLVSCKTLSEGIDLKHANVMLPWDPTNSIVDNIQRIGRVLRLYKTSTGSVAKDQPSSLILVPVFVKEEDVKECKGDRTKIHELLEKQIGMGARGNFQPIINICTALKSELAEEDSELFNQLLHFPNTCPSVPFDNDLISCIAKKLKKTTETVLEEIADVLLEKDELDEETIEQIREEGMWEEEDAGEVMTALTQSQNLTLTLQEKDTIETFGTGAVPLTLTHDGETYKVARTKAKDSGKKHVNQRLSVSHTDGFRILLGLDPDDVADVADGLSTDEMILTRLTTEVQLDEDWEERRLEWVAMYEKLGRKPSSVSKNVDEKRAGQWQGNQRNYYKKKLKCMTPERIADLEATPGWKWEEEDTWEPNRQNWIAQYISLLRNPSQHAENTDERQAGIWQQHQRKDYKKKESWMTPERIAILEATPGWKWGEEDTWEPSRLHWIAQYQRLGKSPSHGSKDHEEKRAGRWQNTQRQNYRKKHLCMTPERIAILEATPGWKWESEDPWEPNRLHWLSQYRRLKKKPSSESKNEDEKWAGVWQCLQRKAYRNKSIILERITALEATEGWTWEEEDTFELNRIHWLSQYQILGKTPSYASKNKDEKKAGTWQSHIRENYKNKESCMIPERIATLEATPGWKWEEEDTWEPNRHHWIAQYQKLGKKPSEHSKNHEEKRAGRWQSNQRQYYKKKSTWMTPERIAILEATPGWTWTGRDSLSTLSPILTIEPPVPPHTLSPTLTIEPADPPHTLSPTLIITPAEPTPKKRIRTVPTATPSTGSTIQRVKSQLEIFHQRFKTMNADTYTKTIAETPTDFTAYHAIASQYDARDAPERQPLNKIAAKLAKNNKPSYKAIDLGCGMNTLRQHADVKNMTWTSIDVHAVDETVLVANMGNLPFDDESFDIAVLSRSLWAKNHSDVLRETYRILKDGGRAIVCESFRRWIDSETRANTLLHALTSVGFIITFEEGTTYEDASDEVFQYIIAQKRL